MAAHGVMFHHFHDDFHPPGQGSISAGELVGLLNLVGRRRILPAAEWLRRAGNNSLGDDDVCLTFDDSLLCQHDIAVPVLRDLGLTAFFFVCSSVLQGNVEMLEVHRHFRTSSFETVDEFYAAFFDAIDMSAHCHRVRQSMLRFNPRTYLTQFPFYSVADRRFRFVRDEVLGSDAYHEVVNQMLADRGVDPGALAARLWMNVDQLRNLQADGHVVGMHSHTHPTRLARLSPQQQRDEYNANHRILRQLTGVAPEAMSHPSNSYSPYTLAILRQLGIRVGFRADMTHPAGCALEFPRQDQANLVAQLRVSRLAA